MKLSDYQLIFIAIGFIGILLVATPTFSYVFHLPSGEPFSELYMVRGCPYSISADQEFSIVIGVNNRMRYSSYNEVFIKLLNITDPLPNLSDKTPSSIQPLSEYKFMVQDGKNWENNITFSISDVSYSEDQVLIKKLILNDCVFDVNKPAAYLNGTKPAFCYQLVFELWTLNVKTSSFEFDNRFVALTFNVTAPV